MLAELVTEKLSSMEAGVAKGDGVGVGLSVTCGAEGPRRAKNQTRNATTTSPPARKINLFQLALPVIGTASPIPVGGRGLAMGRGADGGFMPGNGLALSSSPSFTSGAGLGGGGVTLGPGVSIAGFISLSDCFSI